MATDTYLLMGVVIEDPQSQEKDVEKLLIGLLKALIDEQVIQDSSQSLTEARTEES